MEPKGLVELVEYFVREAAKVPETRIFALGVMGCLSSVVVTGLAVAVGMRGSQHSRMLREAGLISED